MIRVREKGRRKGDGNKRMNNVRKIRVGHLRKKDKMRKEKKGDSNKLSIENESIEEKKEKTRKGYR